MVLSLPLLFIKKENESFIKFYVMTVSLITFFFSVFIYSVFPASSPDFQFVEKFAWVKGLSIKHLEYRRAAGNSLLLRSKKLLERCSSGMEWVTVS